MRLWVMAATRMRLQNLVRPAPAVQWCVRNLPLESGLVSYLPSVPPTWLWPGHRRATTPEMAALEPLIQGGPAEPAWSTRSAAQRQRYGSWHRPWWHELALWW